MELLPSSLHALLQHDFSPACVRFGLRNLCLDLKQLGNDRDGNGDGVTGGDDSHGFGPATTLLPDVLVSVRTTISHLRNLSFRLTTSHLEPRVTSGPLTGSRALPWYNASMPVLPPPLWKEFSSQVERVEGGDARLETPEDVADLHQVWIGNQIRPSIEVWEELERTWGVDVSTGRDLRVCALIALTPETSSSMEEFLRKEKAEWLSFMDTTSNFGTLHLNLFEEAQQRFLVKSSSTFPPNKAISPYN
ncbi:hypothetical protein GQ53DRAFT_842147 [Thozetella sp. PMI_491]|nr:hypothetical protein GQ53DRAFT_842147 [Thozetella sp. PMI_491]